ncbi:ANTAR domain-containing protein [Streptomyces sp. NPDC051320]|uniref:ANTAR domain-containing protein n=1 Tax=Streptomyces sp. NPDC051320 TaxID=3154644 RepID=UPI00341BAA9A
MERQHEWLRSALRLAAASADEATAPHLMRQLCHDCAELLRLPESGVRLAELASPDEHSGLAGDRALINVELRAARQRRPGFTVRVPAEGHTLVTLLPLHGGDARPRAVLQLISGQRKLTAEEVESAQLLGGLAILLQAQSEELRHRRATADQLSRALDSRVVIEQAKGMLAEQLRTDTGEAFDVLRGHARSNRLKLADVARAVLDRQLTLGAGPPG